MFVKEEGKESPVIINQEKTAVLETEGGIRILLRTEAGRRHIWILQKVFLTG